MKKLTAALAALLLATACLPARAVDTHASCAILMDAESGRVLYEQNIHQPRLIASITKLLTALVAVEQGSDLDQVVTVKGEWLGSEGSSIYLKAGEEITLEGLLYGLLLQSGNDAAMAIACHTAGSEADFVALMNQKAAELGLSESARFSNCVGLYSEDNVCTVRDMALILKAAMDNELCRQVLTQKTFDIPPSQAHPEGIPLSNWFIRRIEDHMPEGMEILGAKTGFINESGNCAASMAQDASGRRFLCVTAQAGGVWPCIYDHVALYDMA